MPAETKHLTPSATSSANAQDIEHEIESFVQCFKHYNETSPRTSLHESYSDAAASSSSLQVVTTAAERLLQLQQASPKRPTTLDIGPARPLTSFFDVMSNGTSEETSTSFSATSSGSVYELKSLSETSSLFNTPSEGPSPLTMANYVMGEGATDLTVLDVADLLQAKYAFITGGKDQHGRSLITFADAPHIPDLTEDQYRHLVTYLTTVPTLEELDLGFSIVVDRRRSKWSSVKTILYRISGFFPADLHSVFIVRPRGFFQSRISDVGFKMVKEDYKFQVVMCNNIEELHMYLCKDQLSVDVGGVIEYDQDEWIEHRAAIEKLSLNTINISRSLQTFVEKLEQQESPNDVQSTIEFIQQHQLEKCQMDEDLKTSYEHGQALLNCIRNPYLPNGHDYSELSADKLVHVIAVERLLAQLRDTMTGFERFWSAHERKLEQCLQLRKFEEDFKQIQYVMGKLMSELEALSEPGSTLHEVETNIRTLEEVRTESKEHLEKALELEEIGGTFITSNNYTEDCIRPKCSELTRMVREYRAMEELRESTLTRSLELQQRLDKASSWCNQGVDLLASQQIEHCQTTEGATAAIADIETFLQAAKSLKLSNPKEFRQRFEQILTPETRDYVQTLLKRIDDVQSMCSKRKESLRKVVEKPARPVQVVTPEPAQTRASDDNDGPHARLRRKRIDPAVERKVRSMDLRRAAQFRVEIVKEAEREKTGGSCLSLDSDLELSGGDILYAKRRCVMKELIDTERMYVDELRSIIDGYMRLCDDVDLVTEIPADLRQKRHILFGNIEEIYAFHNDVFLRDLENCWTTPALVGRCFVDRKEELQIYSVYCQNKPRSEILRKQIGDNHQFFKHCQKKLGHKLPLSAYLLKPVQRITKYHLLLKEMSRFTPEDEAGVDELRLAVAAMMDVLHYVNDVMHSLAIKGFPDIETLGKFLMLGKFSVWTGYKKDKIKDIASRFKPQQRHLFLYEQGLLFCKKQEDPNNVEKAHYVMKNFVKTADIGLTEVVKSDNKKFEIWLHGRTEVYSILADTLKMKERWANEIKRLLLMQLTSLKEQQQRIRRGSLATGLLGYDNRFNAPMLALDTIQNSANNNLSMSDISQDDGWSSDEFDDSGSDMVDGRCFTLINNQSDTQESVQHFVILADYNKLDENEVNVKEGDIVEVLKFANEGWWFVRVLRTNGEGWVPSGYVESPSREGSRSTLSSIDSSSGVGACQLKPSSSKTSVTSGVSLPSCMEEAV